MLANPEMASGGCPPFDRRYFAGGLTISNLLINKSIIKDIPKQ